MNDPGFVAAAYAIVLGGLSLYVASIARRLRAARRTAEVLEHEHERFPPGPAQAPATLPQQPSEARR